MPLDAASSADLWVARLSCEHAAIVWPKVEPLLAPAIERSEGLWTCEDVAKRVTSEGDWSLWFVADKETPVAAWITSILYFPRVRMLEVVFAGGIDMGEWYDLALGETEKYARALGCSRIRGYGRRGWPGYRAIGYVVERSL